ncbi:MAG: tyrosine-type recombinase/integrase [Pirellulales bacterium]
MGLKAYLYGVSTSKNGHPNSVKKPLAEKHIRNILESLRSLFNWALKPELRKLPVEWCNPVTIDFLGPKIRKNPLREDPIPVETRIRLVENMELAELYRLSWSIVMPLRSSEVSGIMISEVDMDKSHIRVGERLDGFDFTKGKTSFSMPFPVEFRPLLTFCIGSRAEGPLILQPEYLRNSPDFQPCSQEEFKQKVMILTANVSQKKIQCKNDRKSVFREFLYKQCGGINDKQMNILFKTVCERVGLQNVCIRDLRSSVSTSMERSGMPHLMLRYLTSHTVSDIMNEYVFLEPQSEMQKYFDSIRPLLKAIEHRLKAFGLT